MTVPHPPSPLDRAFFAIVFTIVVFIMLPLLYFWTEKAA